MNSDELRRLYIALFKQEPTEEAVLVQIESLLHITLPLDFRGISTFYSGGMLGGISHHAIAVDGPSTTIMAETMRLRGSIQLPHTMLVIAEPPESLIVLETKSTDGHSAVIWLDSMDAAKLGRCELLRKPLCWPTYAEFFEFLLNREIEERD